MLEFLVKGSLFLLVVHYIGYPLVVLAVARVRGAAGPGRSAEPRGTLPFHLPVVGATGKPPNHY